MAAPVPDSVVLRVARHHDHLDAGRRRFEQVPHPCHALRVGLRQLIVEDDEGLEGFGDGEAQQQGDLLLRADGQDVELAFGAGRLDAGGSELGTDRELAVPAAGQRRHAFADGRHQGLAEMHGLFLFRFDERLLQEPPGTVVQVQFAFAFLQGVDGVPRLPGPFLDVLAADLFQRALRGAKLHLQLANVGGSAGRSLLRAGEPLRTDRDGWGGQRVQVGTTPIAPIADRVEVLVPGRGTKLGRLALEPGEFISGGGPALGRLPERLPRPILFPVELGECLPRLLDFGGRFDPDLRQLGIDRFELPPQAVTLGARPGENLAPVTCLLRPAALLGLFLSEVSAATGDFPLVTGYRVLQLLAEHFAFSHFGLEPSDALLDGRLVAGLFVKAVDVLFHGRAGVETLRQGGPALLHFGLRDDGAAFELVKAFGARPFLF